MIRESSFPWNPREALRKGFENAEKKFLEMAHDATANTLLDRSGSCAVVALIVGDMCYIANVGDSRAVLSGYIYLGNTFSDGGARVYALTRDHKPTDELECKRIIEAGGQIYQTAAPASLVKPKEGEKQEMIVGPHRVLPGRLSVCRTFGDAEAKIASLGGNPNVVIPLPEIKSFKISDNHDFIIMASDGIFDKMSNKDVVQCVWNGVKSEKRSKVHQQCGVGVDTILKNALLRRSLDNVTTLMVSFSNFKKLMNTAEAIPPIQIARPQSKSRTTAHENEENLSKNSNKQERHSLDMSSKVLAKQAKENIPQNFGRKSESGADKKDPAVINKIVSSSTRATSQKHFDFNAAHIERIESRHSKAS